MMPVTLGKATTATFVAVIAAVILLTTIMGFAATELILWYTIIALTLFIVGFGSVKGFGALRRRN